MFFSAIPKIYYSGTSGKDHKLVTNLLRRVGIRAKIKSSMGLFDTYEVKEGETPEMIAHKLYGDSEYHWIVLMMNDIVDRYHGWPLSTPQFLAFIDEKYDDVNAVHHYEINATSGDTSKTIIVGTTNADYAGASIVTNMEYEESNQDKLRSIRLLDPGYVPQFIEEYASLMNESVI
jgi:hypothetical protein